MNILVRRLQRLNWIPAVATPAAVILMEVFWFYPWLLWLEKLELFSPSRAPLSIGGVIFLLGGGFLATRYLLNRTWSLGWVRWSIILCGLVVVFTVIRSEYHTGYGLFDGQWFAHTGRVLLDFSQAHALMAALPIGAYLWWRGISYGRTPLYTDNVYRTFIIGIASLVLLIIAWHMSMGAGSLEELATTVAPHVAAFFFFALVAMALTNLQSIRQQMTSEDMGPSFNRRWLPILLGVVGGIVLISIGVASIFSPEFLASLSRVVDSVGDFFRQIIAYILIPFGYIAAGLFWLGKLLLNLVRGDSVPEFETPEFFAEEDEFEIIPGEPVSEVIIVALKWTLFAIVAIVVIYFLARAISRFRAHRAKADFEEVSESLWTWEAFVADIRLFLSSVWQRLWRRHKAVEPGVAKQRRYLEEDDSSILDIREIYRRLLWQTSRLGMGRRKSETPFEYHSRLVQLIPDGREPLTELTNLYVNVRYGETEIQSRQENRANRLWRTLKEIVRPPPPRRPT